MEEKKTMSRFTVRMDGTDYELDRGGGLVPGVPIPADTVDTAAIIDGAVRMDDLNEEVTDAMVMESDRVRQEDIDSFDV